MKEELRKTFENPFQSVASGYGYVRDGVLISVYPEGSTNREFHIGAHDYFKQFVQSSLFPCIAGQAAVRRSNYAFCSYPDMESS